MKKYQNELLRDMNVRKEIIKNDHLKITKKPLPETDDLDAIDLRLLDDQGKMANLLSYINIRPQSFLNENNIDVENTLDKIRPAFNSVNSISLNKTSCYKTYLEDRPLYVYFKNTEHRNKIVIYYLHGGGYFAGHTKVIEDALKLLVEQLDCVVVSYDYALAPEAPFPASYESALLGLEWTKEHLSHFNGSIDKLFVAGDSAGANLALHCSNIDSQNEQQIKGQILLYPTLDLSMHLFNEADFTSENLTPHQRRLKNEHRIFHFGLKLLAELLKADEKDPRLSPLLYPNPNYPQTFIAVGDRDFLAKENIEFARTLANLNIDTDFLLYYGIGHAFIDEIGNLPQAEDCIIEIAQWLKEHQ